MRRATIPRCPRGGDVRSAVLVVFFALFLPATAHALSCRQILDLSAAGTPASKLISSIQSGPALTTDDIACLVAGAAPEAVLSAARARVPPSAAAVPGMPAAIPLDIAFVGVELGETRDGKAWDFSIDGVPTGLVALGSRPLAAGIGLAKVAAGDASLPDPFGKVNFVPVGADDADLGLPRWFVPRDSATEGSNTLTPEVASPPAWRGWLTGPSTAFRVQMFDLDGGEAERFPPVIIGYDALVAALEAGGVFQVSVADQSANQVRTVSLRVTRSVATDPVVDGALAR